MKARVTLLSTVCAVLACVSSSRATVVIETVPVGNPGNAPDTRYDATGYGGVNYEYNIGKYEATAGQYAEFLNAVAAEDTYGLYNENMWSGSYDGKVERSGSSGSYSYSVVSGYANRPVNYVSWGDAARFANWLHNGQPTGAQDLTTTEDGAYYLNGATTNAALLAVSREADWKWAIASEDEWYKAAYYDPNKVGGVGYWDYPTGTDDLPSNDFVNPDPGNNATFYDGGWTIGGPYYRTEAGEHENSDSPYNTFDQGGNVWEWNEAVIGSSCGMRGGSFAGYGAHYYGGDRLLASSRSNYPPPGELYDIGFRVSEVPEPATLGMLLVGSMISLRRRQF